MTPLGELAAPVAQAAVDAAVAAVLSDLRERLVKEREDLHVMARGYTSGVLAHTVLIAEARGVRMALTCLDEAIKETQR